MVSVVAPVVSAVAPVVSAVAPVVSAVQGHVGPDTTTPVRLGASL